ncbi:hypothetical protein [Indiicoccus explosivorum]|uniref:hypothetical protein n=1 Tax=Indiicoccus explosivorum TaxID=1917864 RepID=UPI000B42EBAD|nr:hypothetical protein [Indiicoccus explosivorum]
MIDEVWNRIIKYDGQEFTQIRGQKFTYKVAGNSLVLSTTNHAISRRTLEKAFQFVPLENTVPIQNLFAPSYLFALLNDERIRQGEW